MLYLNIVSSRTKKSARRTYRILSESDQRKSRSIEEVKAKGVFIDMGYWDLFG